MNTRLEMFPDGVFAIAVTLLIPDIIVPRLESVHSVAAVGRNAGWLWPFFFALTLRFVIILISWVGQHSLLRTLDKASSQFHVANGFFLFTVILIPFPTAFMAAYLDTSCAQPVLVVYCLNGIWYNAGWNILYW